MPLWVTGGRTTNQHPSNSQLQTHLCTSFESGNAKMALAWMPTQNSSSENGGKCHRGATEMPYPSFLTIYGTIQAVAIISQFGESLAVNEGNEWHRVALYHRAPPKNSVQEQLKTTGWAKLLHLATLKKQTNKKHYTEESMGLQTTKALFWKWENVLTRISVQDFTSLISEAQAFSIFLSAHRLLSDRPDNCHRPDSPHRLS